MSEISTEKWLLLFLILPVMVVYVVSVIVYLVIRKKRRT